MAKTDGSGKMRASIVIERQIRYGVFGILTAFTFAAYLFAAVYDIRWTGDDYDTCLVMYSLNALIALACAVLFTVHWIHRGHATEVFVFVTFLFYAMALDYGIQFVVRYHSVCDGVQWILPMNSWWWELRSMPRMIISCYMFGLVLGRMFGERDK